METYRNISATFLDGNCKKCSYWINKGCCHMIAREKQWSADDDCRHLRPRALHRPADGPGPPARW